MAQREMSVTVAVAPGPAVAAEAVVPSSSSSSGAPAAGGERWSAAIGNLGELGANVESLQKLLARKAVFVDDDIFSKASLAADQARTIKLLWIRFLTRGCSLWNANLMLPSLQQLELVQRNARLKPLSELQSYVHRRSQRSWRTLQKCLRYTWKSCGRSKRRLQRKIVISRF